MLIMSILLDGIILIVCAVIIFKSIKAGFIKSVMGLIKGIASFIAAYAFTGTLGNIIKEKFIIGGLSGNIEDTLHSLAPGGEGTQSLENLIKEMPDALNQIVERYGAQTDNLTQIVKDSPSGEDAVKKVADCIADPIAGSISNVIAFILIFAAVFIALTIITALLDAVFHLPVLHGANKLFGIAFGVAEALLFAFVLSYLGAELMKALGSVDSKLFGEQVIENSVILKFFSNHNLLDIIGNVIG